LSTAFPHPVPRGLGGALTLGARESERVAVGELLITQ
jgi:hypothetical protein